MSENHKDSFFELKFDEEIAIIKIKGRVFEMITDIEHSYELIHFIDSLDRNRSAKALLFYNEPGCLDNKSYESFLSGIMDLNEINDDLSTPCFSEKNARFREINVLNSLIKKMIELQILVVAGMQDTVVTPFVGASLSADLRFAAKGTVLSMIHNKYGLHPSGGLPFFLACLTGHSKAIELQMRNEISADEALSEGMIQAVLPGKDFEQELIREVRKYTKLNHCTIRNTKRLTSYNRKTLYRYFEFEAGLLNL